VLNPGDDFCSNYLVQFKGAVLVVELGPHVTYGGRAPSKALDLIA
jgi:hypothetical protein